MSEQAEWRYELWRLNPDGTETRLHRRGADLALMIGRADYLCHLNSRSPQFGPHTAGGQRYAVRDRAGDAHYMTEAVR